MEKIGFVDLVSHTHPDVGCVNQYWPVRANASHRVFGTTIANQASHIMIDRIWRVFDRSPPWCRGVPRSYRERYPFLRIPNSSYFTIRELFTIYILFFWWLDSFFMVVQDPSLLPNSPFPLLYCELRCSRHSMRMFLETCTNSCRVQSLVGSSNWTSTSCVSSPDLGHIYLSTTSCADITHTWASNRLRPGARGERYCRGEESPPSNQRLHALVLTRGEGGLVR